MTCRGRKALLILLVEALGWKKFSTDGVSCWVVVGGFWNLQYTLFYNMYTLYIESETKTSFWKNNSLIKKKWFKIVTLIFAGPPMIPSKFNANVFLLFTYFSKCINTNPQEMHQILSTQTELFHQKSPSSAL